MEIQNQQEKLVQLDKEKNREKFLKGKKCLEDWGDKLNAFEIEKS